MEKIENIFAKNLIILRKKNNLTQVNLAERLNYSDKSISKWERAEAIPDVVVLKQIADLFNVTVDYLITDHNGEKEVEKEVKLINSKGFVLALSIVLVWVVVMVAYFLFQALLPETFAVYNYLWLLFIYGIVFTFITSTVFFSVWRKNVCNCISTSCLLWSVALALHLSLMIKGAWLIYLVAVPIQVLLIIWFVFVKLKKVRKLRLNKNN
ncbi:MAG: helix-turn-helix transcriptional regulator [Clostridiales bacterium]|nr:helix-turn-helix transcriptional regulator [Clostridiales bacterium]